MASEFQRRKVAAVMDAMDVDHDGFLEEEDFEALTERWVAIRGWEPGSPGYERMRAIMMGWWEALLAMSDRDRDNKVTLDELMLTVDQLPGMRDSVIATADAMFDAIDEDGDGHVTIDEHKQVVQAWKGTVAGVDEVFARMDLKRRWLSVARGVSRAVGGLLDRRRPRPSRAVDVRPVLAA